VAIGKWCCKKEPRNKSVVVGANGLLLGVDIAEQGGDQGKDMVYRTHMGQINNGEGGEEILVMDIQCFDAELQKVCEDDDSEVEE